MKLYLAGPLGFSEVGRQFQDEIMIPLLSSMGFEVINPWKLTDAGLIATVQQMPYGSEKRAAWKNLNATIGENNRLAIERCDLLVAVLDGVDIDSGTAAEIGYAFAKGKRIFGYRGDFRLSADNEGAEVNLQVEYFIEKSGGSISHDLAELSLRLTNN